MTDTSREAVRRVINQCEDEGQFAELAGAFCDEDKENWCLWARGIAALLRDLLAERDALLEAAEAVLNTVNVIWGKGPEDADDHTHEKWAMDELRKQVTAINTKGNT